MWSDSVGGKKPSPSCDVRTAGVPRVLGHSSCALAAMHVADVAAVPLVSCSTSTETAFALQDIRHFHGFAIVDPGLASSSFCNEAPARLSDM